MPMVDNLTQITSHATIQDAINSANPGDVLQLNAGSYSENVVITKSLTLQGATSDKTLYVIDGTGLPSPGSGIVINVNVTNVTIRDLTVQDFTGSSGNTHAAIYGIGGNNNLTVTNVAMLNNPTASGFYANGPVDNVSITNCMVQNNGGSARGVVIWNGFKTNINITGNTVINNSCCGIELQDGTASGVIISNSILDIGTGDNGLGLTGLNSTIGSNLISNNNISGGGRFGIEIKNPEGGVMVSGNTVNMVSANADLRDRAGIAILRRSVLVGNVDVPNGVTITGNNVSGWTQSSSSEGFGIVVEGINHTISGNNVSGCDVGILQQQNPSNYPADADQSNVADLYFGRGNSPMTCNNVITGNTVSAITDNYRNIGVGTGLVTNTNTSEAFCSIQSAINDAQTLAGHTLSLGPLPILKTRYY
ncbi:MAG: right-handed parallel beta-helix repeat-containing protein [Saprospiraceae bacterium]|nr:right-handed parallel beta-helix repeat-containing protein [Saprospiraceae bacterium]